MRALARALGDAADAGAEPADVDVEIVERAAAEAARHLAHLDLESLPTTNSAPASRACCLQLVARRCVRALDDAALASLELAAAARHALA